MRNDIVNMIQAHPLPESREPRALAEWAYQAFVNACPHQWVFDVDNPECGYPIGELQELLDDSRTFGGVEGVEVGFCLEFDRKTFDLKEETTDE